MVRLVGFAAVTTLGAPGTPNSEKETLTVGTLAAIPATVL